MKNHAMTDKTVAKNPSHNTNLEKYHSVEILINGINIPYQFKIWQITPHCIWVLVKEDSNILPHLKLGDALNIKCYPTNRAFPPEYIDTTIHHINMNDQGRFKGHCLIGLEALERMERIEHHQALAVNASQILPLNAL